MEFYINEDSLREACKEYITACDSMQCHLHLRIDGDGDAYVTADVGYCISQDEFNKAPDCTMTVRHQAGWGQNNLEDDWHTEPDGHESIEQLFDSIVEDLKRDGFEVVFVEGR